MVRSCRHTPRGHVDAVRFAKRRRQRWHTEQRHGAANRWSHPEDIEKLIPERLFIRGLTGRSGPVMSKLDRPVAYLVPCKRHGRNMRKKHATGKTKLSPHCLTPPTSGRKGRHHIAQSACAGYHHSNIRITSARSTFWVASQHATSSWHTGQHRYRKKAA